MIKFLSVCVGISGAIILSLNFFGGYVLMIAFVSLTTAQLVAAISSFAFVVFLIASFLFIYIVIRKKIASNISLSVFEYSVSSFAIISLYFYLRMFLS
jgi:hypothetical protein